MWASRGWGVHGQGAYNDKNCGFSVETKEAFFSSEPLVYGSVVLAWYENQSVQPHQRMRKVGGGGV